MKLTIKVLTIVFFLFFGVQHIQAQCDGTSDIIQNSRNLELSTTTNINVGMGSSFTATCSGVIEGVSFWTYRVPGTIGQTSVTVELYRNPFSSSRVLMSSVTTDISFQSEGSVERYFEFQNSPSLVAGTVYGVRFINNAANQIIDLDLHTGNRLAGGNMFVNNFDQSSPWSTRDLRFQIHYQDNVAPVANCRNITRTLGTNGTVSISFGNINSNSTDADSGIASFFLSQNTFDCSNIGENTVTLTVRDQNGNAANCQAIVTILDETAPILTCPSDITVYTDPGVPIAVTYNDIGYDDCSIEAPENFTFLGKWLNKYYFISDNTIQIDQAFAEAESLVGHVATVIDADHNEFIRSRVNSLLGTTNEQVLIGYNDVASEGSFVWHAGNENSGYVNWAANEPNNVGNEDYTVIRNDGLWNDLPSTQVRRYILQTTDPNIIQTTGFVSGDFFPVGTTTNTFEATDAFGNTGTCSFDVTVVQNPYETTVSLVNGKLTITDMATNSDDQISFSNDGSTLTISGLVAPVDVSGSPILLNETTVTVQLANITNGIEFIGGNGDNTITIVDALTLNGADNDISLSGLSNYTQPGVITIDGDFSVTDSPAATVVIGGLIANNLSITNVFSVADTPERLPMTIMGTTNLQASNTISVNYGTNTHTFNDLVTLDCKSITFSAGADVTLGAVSVSGTNSTFNLIDIRPGTLFLSDNVQIAGNSDLYLIAQLGISQIGGNITADELTIQGSNDGSGIVLLPNNNDVNSISTLFNQSLSLITFRDIDDVAIGEFTADQGSIIAPNIIFTENTNFNKIGSGSITFNGSISVTNGNANREATINHNEGTINFSGPITDFSGELDYNSSNGVITNFDGTTTLDTDGISPIFATINSSEIFTVDVFTNVLSEARFSGATAVLKGRGPLVGAPIIVENDASITPGSIGNVASLLLSDLSISSATFAPTIENDNDYDILEVQGTVTLTDATFSPVTNSGTFGNTPITLIENDGTDAIVGTFNNYPEGSTVQIGNYTGLISYVGGDGGNDMTISVLETTVELFQGKLDITDANGGSSDDQITFSNDGTTLTISGLTAPVAVTGGPTLTDATTVTIPLASITGGIEFISGNGNDAITIANDLTLTGATNDLKFNSITNFTQNGFIDIEGALEITGETNTVINLDQTTAGSLTISNVFSVEDAGGKITIAGATNLTTSDQIVIDNGEENHEFNGSVALSATRITFTAGASLSFSEVIISATDPFANYLIASPGTITLDGNVEVTERNTNFILVSNDGIFQQSGFINNGFLLLRGNGTGNATLDQANTVGAISVENAFDSTANAFINLSFTNTIRMFLEIITVDEFTLTAPQFDIQPGFTLITKNGSGVSNFNADFDVNSGTGTAIINHNAGTINFNGQVNDFLSQMTYNGVAGTITNINGGDTDFPSSSADNSFTFGFLNATGDVFIDDITINILNTATFSEANTLITGAGPLLSGGDTIFQNNATITPGAGTTGATYSFSSLEMTSGATFAPFIQGTTGTNRDQLEVEGTVTLNNAILAPTGGFIIQAGEEVILIDNDGTDDPVQGMFDSLPEGAGVSFGNFRGIITYTGGNGNDVSLIRDNINPIAICQNLTFALNPGQFVQVSPSQIDNGSSDNVQIGLYLLNDDPNELIFEYDDLGDNEVTLTILDLAGNIAQCNATITITSNATLPILISEYQPELPNEDDPSQTIEIFGGAGEIFSGVISIIEGDIESGQTGLVVSSYSIGGTFDANGLLTATVPNLVGPSHTIVLSSSFSGTIGTTNIDENDDGIAENISSLGVIFDAISVVDENIDINRRYASGIGGTDLPNIDGHPHLVFRDASTGDFYLINDADQIYDLSGNIIPSANFTSTPSSSTNTFGQINPALIPPIEVPQVVGELQANAETTITTAGFTVGSITTSYSNTVPAGSVIDQNPDAGNFMQPGTAIDLVISDGFNPNEFITKWKTTSDNETIEIPLAVVATRSMTINWGDGTIQSYGADFPSHTYATAGEYIITATGDIESIRFNNGGSRLNILEVMQWGSTPWVTFQNAFYGCEYLVVTAVDEPDYTILTSFRNMFRGTLAPTQNILHWNTNSIMEMQGMFRDSNFNGDISNWDVSNVFNMANMFLNNSSFNIDISNWSVAKVQNMSSMFRGATNFDQNLGSWDISSVTNMQDMFNEMTLSTANYDATLIGWATDTSGAPNDNSDDIPTTINFSGGNSQFCDAVLERQALIDLYTWTINDAEVASNCNSFTPFITTWQTTTDNESITIPTTGTGYHYLVDWGDGTQELVITGDATHTYATAGTHTVSIVGDFPQIYFNNTGDRLKIREVQQWGSNSWTSMVSAFQGCRNLIITATDAPDLSNATSMNGMFRDAAKDVDITLWQDISHWDVSTIINMEQVFRGMDFNQDIATWDVSNVTNMGAMFRGNKKFNQDISSWNVSNVTNMSNMFYLASDFNQDISSWDVSNVQSMNIMLRATNFNHDLSAWDISSITNMANIFTGSEMSVENYDNTIIGWATLDTASGETQIPVNIPLGATNINYCEAEFNRQELIDTYGWAITDAGKAVDCNNSFITTWQTTADNESITIPTIGSGYNYLVDWGDGTVEVGINGDATHTYATAETYTVSITGNFPRIYFISDESDNTEKIKEITQWGNIQWSSMEGAFTGCLDLNVTATDAPDLSNVTNTTRMFSNCTSLLGNAAFNTWDMSTIQTMSYMFSEATNFNTDLNNWNVANVTNMAALFNSANAFNGNISTWDTGEVINMFSMFASTTAFEGIGGLNNWNVSKVEKMGGMFRFAEAFNQDLNNWNVANVNDMTSIFWGASAFNGNISTWNITSLTKLDHLFREATNFNGDLSQWNVSNIQSLYNTFSGATSFNTDLNNWNVSNVTNMQETFNGASSFNQPLDNWNVSNVKFLYRMFYNATNFNQDLSTWDISKVTDANNIFSNTNLSTENYDAILIGWSTLDTSAGETAIPNGILFGAENIKYCLSETERTLLMTPVVDGGFGWTITDGDQDTNCARVLISPKVYLQGASLNPNVGEEHLMRDDLRVAGLIPTTSPYADGLTTDTTVFDVTGDNAIVDWVWVELRNEIGSEAPPPPGIQDNQKSALLQRDGDVVAIDGVSPLTFDLPADNYHVVIKHRNHLGIMSASAIALSSTATTIDFTDVGMNTYGTHAQIDVSLTGAGPMAMLGGDADGNGFVNISGTGDSGKLSTKLYSEPDNTAFSLSYTGIEGYYNEDLDMDGKVLYSAGGDFTQLQTMLYTHPGNTGFSLSFSGYTTQLPIGGTISKLLTTKEVVKTPKTITVEYIEINDKLEKVSTFITYPVKH